MRSQKRTVRRSTKRNPAYRRRRRSNPARTNPGSGIQGIIMGGFWIGAGMWMGGLIQGFIPNIGSGMVMDLVKGVGSAYIVGMVAGRFTGNAGLMAAGAFAPTAWGVVSSLMGGVTGSLSSLTSGFGGGSSKPATQPTAAPQIAPGSITVASVVPPTNVTQFPQAG